MVQVMVMTQRFMAARHGFPDGLALTPLGLNGTSDYGLAADDASLDIANAITLAAWIRPEKYATQDSG